MLIVPRRASAVVVAFEREHSELSCAWLRCHVVLKNRTTAGSSLTITQQDPGIIRYSSVRMITEG